MYLLKGLIVVEPKIGVKLSEWGPCRNGVNVEMGTCRNGVHIPHSKFFGCLLDEILVEKLFSKGMDDRGIMRTLHLCAQVFEFLVQTHTQFTGLIFFSKVKGMNDRGSMRTLHICARDLPKIEK